MDARLFRLARLHSFLPLAGATLMLGVAMSFTAPYLSLFSVQEAGMTPLQLGLFMTLIAASGVLASALAGKWTDRHGRHRMLLMSALIASSLGFLLLCLLRSYASLLVIGIVFLGVGSSAMSLVFSFARVALPVTSHAERSLALATLRTVLSMAWVFGPSVGALVLAGAGFHGLFVFAAVSFAACSVIVWRMKDAARISASAEPHYAGDPASSLEVTTMTEHAHPAEPHPEMEGTRAQIWRAAIALTLIGLAANATMIVLPLYVVQGLRGTQIDVSIMLGLGAFLEIPMMLALGARGARLDKQRWLAACAVVHVVYFVAVSASQTVHLLIPMQAFNAFVVAVTSCLGMVYIQDMMPRNPGAATALFFNASRVGSILSGVLSGALVAAMGYRITFLACGGLALGAFVLFANPPFKSMALQLRGWWTQWRQPAR
ncbi:MULTISPECIES: sugar efflux transporter [unclassified Caballeronia]|uniref:sugar efflux transporter n=1 Tax=unclassified Caballeronia TaxID=2646786 RepID=UPI002859D111|nr:MULTISPECIES: sugar efflux transporter [unclassified Caballeronia]MDR5741465.1 sugar efflux transporter [Caballeronia sp. LZ016]MDR5806778.1 sugar efflux transporter [Caballeronia sp. LZ019]